MHRVWHVTLVDEMLKCDQPIPGIYITAALADINYVTDHKILFKQIDIVLLT